MPTRPPNPITTEFLTYNSKLDPYNMPQTYLSVGSRNVLINALEKVRSREGYILQSPVGVSGSTVPGSVEWHNSTGGEIPLRALSTEDKLQAYLNGNWEDLLTSIPGIAPSFDAYWDDSQKIDRLVWVDGTADMKDWSGGVATLQSVTSSTITLQGSKTFAQLRFLLTISGRSIMVKDDTGTWHKGITYTGGEGTSTLTGLSVDLTAFPISGGNLIIQEVITDASLISDSFFPDWLRVVDNQIIVGSRISNDIYGSKNTSPIDFSFSTPRLTGEGFEFTLDGPSRGIGVLKGDLILFAGQGLVYKSTFAQITVGDILAETVKVSQLKTTDLQSAQHNELIANIGDGLCWIGNDNVLYELLDATLAYNPTINPLSDPLKPDFDGADFGNVSGNWGHLRLVKNRIYISAPANGTCFIREYTINEKFQKVWFWQSPLNLPVKRWAVISSDVSGHSTAASETYTLFTGYRDRANPDGSGGGPIDAILRLGRWNGGARDTLKDGDEFFIEGNASPNVLMNFTWMFDLDAGEQQNVYKSYSPGNDGSNQTGMTDAKQSTVYTSAQDPSLGNLALGDMSLSGDVAASLALPHFRVLAEIANHPFFDYGFQIETNDLDQQWEIMAIGSNTTLSTSKVTGVKI